MWQSYTQGLKWPSLDHAHRKTEELTTETSETEKTPETQREVREETQVGCVEGRGKGRWRERERGTVRLTKLKM